MLCSTLSLLSVSSLLHLASLVDATQTPEVKWLSPSDGDAYVSGDTIVGRWDTDKAVVSPSFRLCNAGAGVQRRSRHEEDNDESGGDDGGEAGSAGDEDDGSCGEAVWPTIQSNSDGSYMIHMSLPNISSVSHCYLEMVDDFGNKMPSPAFAFRPTSQAGAETDASDEPAPDAAETSPAPHASATSPSSATATSTSHTSASDKDNAKDKDKVGDKDGDGDGDEDQDEEKKTRNPPQTLPSLDDSHIPAPTAAYAVPLSLVLSVILVAGGLAFRQRRKLRAERKLEQEALQTRQTLSRHSTLSYGGFLALGNGPPPPPPGSGSAGGAGARGADEPQSRSTSVNMMRAWRRDVSRYDRHGRPRGPSDEYDKNGPGSGVADDETYVARTDDGRSVVSSSSAGVKQKRAPQPQMRPTTREPYYTTRPQRARRTMVPASVFRAAVSPVMPPHEGDGYRGYQLRDDHYPAKKDHHGGEDGWRRLKGKTLDTPDEKPRRGVGIGEECVNASVNDEVMSRYYEFSPIPLSPAPPPRQDFSIAPPEQLHVRRYAGPVDHSKILPPSPSVVDRDLYDVVAKKLSGR